MEESFSTRKFLNKYNDQTEDLTFQVEFIKFLHDEQQDITWKSYIYAVPRRVMSFAMRASTNSLATPDKMARWGKVVLSSLSLWLLSPTRTNLPDSPP